MFDVRTATVDDAPAVARVIRARAAWMRREGLEDWEAWWHSADAMAARATRPRAPARLLVHRSGAVVGCTTLSATASDEEWSTVEREQPARYLSTTCTDPAWRGHRPGAVLAAWALEETAAAGAAWLRLSCADDRLMRYYRDVQGFALVRTVTRTGVTYLLARSVLDRPAAARRPPSR
ncbi:GNAT family N-acetyltransferase [Streptomyces sp.]|uniref:GNAT family N-acetyltransferase n=1 Tax=Streptomyces sp. TaxID=1931 RepID=UPI002811F3BD|nr:GNAT family N-acetyltransferase [Streptomyces sp.]